MKILIGLLVCSVFVCLYMFLFRVVVYQFERCIFFLIWFVFAQFLFNTTKHGSLSRVDRLAWDPWILLPTTLGTSVCLPSVPWRIMFDAHLYWVMYVLYVCFGHFIWQRLYFICSHYFDNDENIAPCGCYLFYPIFLFYHFDSAYFLFHTNDFGIELLLFHYYFGLNFKCAWPLKSDFYIN